MLKNLNLKFPNANDVANANTTTMHMDKEEVDDIFAFVIELFAKKIVIVYNAIYVHENKKTNDSKVSMNQPQVSVEDVVVVHEYRILINQKTLLDINFEFETYHEISYLKYHFLKLKFLKKNNFCF